MKTDEKEREAENQTIEDLRNIKDYLGSWDDLRSKIDELEEGDFEAAFESRYSY